MSHKTVPIQKKGSLEIKVPTHPVKPSSKIHKSKTSEFNAAGEKKSNDSNGSTHDEGALKMASTNNFSLFYYIDFHFLAIEREQSKQCLITVPSKKIIIFDLDETLIYNTAREYSLQTPIIFPRPFYYEMFCKLNEFYEIWIWSASELHYIKSILKSMDPNRAFVRKILSKHDCTLSKEGFLIKDIGRFTNLDLSKVVFIDNMASSFIMNIENGLLISSFNGSCNDVDLIDITSFLLRIKEENDLRPAIMKYRI